MNVNDGESEVMDREPTRREWQGYWSMIVQQTQNAFNDKAAQFILIPLGGAVTYGVFGVGVESLAGALIALPFVLFAPLAGWLSDRFSKRIVILGAAIAQVLILLMICGAVFWRTMGLALVGFFLLAVQSAFFGPAKMGINKELVGSRHLGFATGVQQMLAMLGMLLGQVVAGWWFDKRYEELGKTAEVAWSAALVPLVVLLLCSLPAVLLAFVIPRVPAHGGDRLTGKVLISHFRDLGQLWADSALRQASFGVAYFWGFAAFINLWSVKVAKAMTDGGAGFGTISSKFMASASMGMVLGFGFASWLLRRRIELGWVPLAGLMMTLTALVLAFLSPWGWAFLIVLGILAFSSALFLAPLNAWMQDRYPAAKRGEMQSAANLQDCFAGIIALAAIEVMILLANLVGLSQMIGFRVQLIVVAVSCGVMSWFVIRLLPADFVRLVCLGVLRMVYRVKVTGTEKIPKDGGVLLVPNHVTYADSFYVSAVTDRPLRFVMDEMFMQQKLIRFSASLFGTVPINRNQPLEAVRKTIEVLEKGDAVVLFPEGQLTRTGSLCELERGFELIARKAKVPVIPIWVDGAWGSIFSFERGRFFKKWPYSVPYGLSIAVGDVIADAKMNGTIVRNALMKVSAVAVRGRFSAKASDAEVNAYQLTQLGALPRKALIHLLEGDEDLDGLVDVLRLFAKLTKGKLLMEKQYHKVDGAIWVGGRKLRESVVSANGGGKEEIFFDFSSSAFMPMKNVSMVHMPCFAMNGLVVAMSMPHPPVPNETSVFQDGHKEDSWGRILPGWYIEDRMLMPLGVMLPDGVQMDESGFLVKSLRAAADTES